MEQIKELLYRHSIGTCTPAERLILEKWAADNKERRALLERLGNPDYIADRLNRRMFVDSSRPKADMSNRLKKNRPRYYSMIISVAAAITVIFTFATVFVMSYSNQNLSTTQPDIAETVTEPVALESIHHGTTQAKLTSSTGVSKLLTAADTVGVQNIIHAKITAQSAASVDVAELCLDVPRGGEFKVILEDSTEVWLNSESTLRYPEVFGSDERRVEVTGEAYFSVKRDTSRPFIVESKGQAVRVYGTTFNIRSYNDDEITYTTLETGSIALSKTNEPGGEIFLSPGHQALFDRNSKTVDMKVVDPAVITCWRNGQFVFEEQPLKNIMKDLARWYDFEYEFIDPDIENIVFMGSIPRYKDFASAITIIQKSGGLNFEYDGQKVMISRKSAAKTF